MEKITAKSYTLRTESGQWMGQLVLTSDGMIAGVTDYGAISYAWRSFGEKDFRKFILDLNVSYFGDKLYSGFSYMVHNKTMEKACYRVAEKILPVLQKVLKEEIESESL